ncbi:DUF3040 domain-containing protein [Streptomyces sp. NPDC006551]|uniref:DUF3040 domain-containing protein n=1 Tax=Streptomyces sp. NPDC006551 TaxID=3157178 RepID=UPI00339E65B3
MEEARLSQRERRILAEIERELREDAPLERRLRTMRRGAGLPALSAHGRRERRRDRRAALGTALSGLLALSLLVSAVATGAPVLIWAFAAVWVVTLVCLLRLVIHWSTKTRTRT